MNLLRKFYEEEDGIATIEIVMIIAALMCIALLFREQLFGFAQDIMEIVFDTGAVQGASSGG